MSSSSPGGTRASTSKATGNFRVGNATRVNRSSSVSSARSAKNWTSASRVGTELLACTHEYPERVIELHFFECVMEGEPRPMLGQEMRWVAQAELRSLQFPPADDALIELLERD